MIKYNNKIALFGWEIGYKKTDQDYVISNMNTWVFQ